MQGDGLVFRITSKRGNPIKIKLKEMSSMAEIRNYNISQDKATNIAKQLLTIAEQVSEGHKDVLREQMVIVCIPRQNSFKDLYVLEKASKIPLIQQQYSNVFVVVNPEGVVELLKKAVVAVKEQQRGAYYRIVHGVTNKLLKAKLTQAQQKQAGAL